MNPYPLTAPDGAVAAYACGVCHAAYAEVYYMNRYEHAPETPHSERVTAVGDALKCCMCSCGRQKEKHYLQFCPNCFAWNDFTTMWRNIGVALKLQVKNNAVWLCVLDHLDYGEHMTPLNDALYDRVTPPVELRPAILEAMRDEDS